MQPEIAQQLIELNHQFYQTFAEHFSETRQRLQPGVLQALEGIASSDRVLDLGCGNGRLAAYLAENGHIGSYTGIDTSTKLIEIAQQQQIPNTYFYQADLTHQNWGEHLAQSGYDAVLCFAVLHHIPSSTLRTRFLEQVRDVMVADGLFFHSNWQFLLSPKLRARVQPWEHIGLSRKLVDDQDYLLDWRRGGSGLRYVHHFSSPELNSLANQTGFRVLREYSSDGDGGNLGLYQVWERV